MDKMEGVNVGDEVRLKISPDEKYNSAALKQHSDYIRKPSKLHPVVNARGLVELRLVRKGLEVLPDEVLTLMRLEALIISENRLHGLPAEIGRLHKLRELDVHKNSLLVLPDTILNLVHLTTLDLRCNKLSTLPQPLSLLKKLRVFRVGNNRLEEVPTELGDLTSLRELDLSGNRLWHLPESVSCLHHLTHVSLADNKFDQLPISLCEIEGIECLELQANRLLNLPPHLAKLHRLKQLNVSHNMLTSIPKSVFNLLNLQTLNVGNNQITDIPVDLARLPALQSVHACNNMIASLPNDLVNLHHLNVSHNRLANFSVTRMKQLRHLDSSHNVLENLPLGVYVLPQLEVLALHHNKIAYVSQDIVLLRKLRVLDLSHNKLTCLPNVIEEMSHLESFNVRHNKLDHGALHRNALNKPNISSSQPQDLENKLNRAQHSLYKKKEGSKSARGKWQKAQQKSNITPHSRSSSGFWTPQSSVKVRARPPLDFRPRSSSLSAITSPFNAKNGSQVDNKLSGAVERKQQPQHSKGSLQQVNPVAEISYPLSNTTPVPPTRRKRNKSQKSNKENITDTADDTAHAGTSSQVASNYSNIVTVNETVGDNLSLGDEDFDLQPVTVKDDRLTGVCVEVEGMLNSQLLQPIISGRRLFTRKTVNEGGTIRTLQGFSPSTKLASASQKAFVKPSATSDVIHMSKDIYLKRAPIPSHLYGHQLTKVDTFTVTAAGGMFHSSVDPSVTVYFPVNAVDKPVALTMQIERVFLETIKATSRHPLLDNLVAVAPIVHIHQSQSVNFQHQVVLTVPAPDPSHKGTLHLLTYHQSGMCAPCSSPYKSHKGYLTLQAWHFSGKGAVVTKSRCKYKACKSVEAMQEEMAH